MTIPTRVRRNSVAAEALSGNFNVYSREHAFLNNGPRIEFNGTTLDLILRAIDAGAVAGDKLEWPMVFGSRHYVLSANPHETRTPGGLWVERV